MHSIKICIIIGVFYYVLAQDTETSPAEGITPADPIPLNVSLEAPSDGNTTTVSSQNFAYETLKKHWKAKFMPDVTPAPPGNYVQCTPKFGNDTIEIVNASRLIKLLVPDPNLKKDSPADCVVVYFYSPSCPFSCAASRHFNGLARLFPDIKMAAIDAMSHHIFNAQNGITGVPNLVFFHNGRMVARFNGTEFTIQYFAIFIGYATGLTPSGTVTITSEDFRGPLSITPDVTTDYCLGLSWTFIGVCVVYFFSKSKYWRWVVETVQNTWRESAAQHEHNE